MHRYLTRPLWPVPEQEESPEVIAGGAKTPLKEILSKIQGKLTTFPPSISHSSRESEGWPWGPQLWGGAQLWAHAQSGATAPGSRIDGGLSYGLAQTKGAAA